MCKQLTELGFLLCQSWKTLELFIQHGGSLRRLHVSAALWSAALSQPRPIEFNKLLESAQLAQLQHLSYEFHKYARSPLDVVWRGLAALRCLHTLHLLHPSKDEMPQLLSALSSAHASIWRTQIPREPQTRAPKQTDVLCAKKIMC
jgi:hypothetical protein